MTGNNYLICLNRVFIKNFIQQFFFKKISIKII